MESNEKKSITIIDTRCELSYEDYKENCECNGIDPAEEDSSEFWDWVSETQRMYYEDEMENLSWTKIDYPLMVTGRLGLWDGTHEIYPVVVESEGYGRKFHSCDYTGYETPSLKKAILGCLGRDIDDIDVKFEDGEVVVNAYHHDGCNVFCIKKLSKKGIKEARKAKKEGEYCNPDESWFGKMTMEELNC